VNPGVPLQINVGAGGIPGTSAGTNGASGGMSSFGGFLTATGGQGGAGSSFPATSPAQGGTAVGAQFAVDGQDGSSWVLLNGIGYGSQGGGAYGSSISKASYGGIQRRVASFPGGGGPGVTTQQGATLPGWRGANGLVILRGILN
jgi:hypothetical protein